MDKRESSDRLEEAPARIFVLWHPDYAEGARIAAAIFDWFRTPDGHGLPVYYRSQAAPGDERGLPPDIPLDSDKLNFIIVLAEYRMVRDRAWREWLDALAAGAPSSTNIYPVVLHRSAYNLPERIRKVNFIRVHETNAEIEPVEASVSTIWPSLRTSLTEVVARALGHRILTNPLTKFFGWVGSIFRGASDAEPAKLKIFISHAKRDGTGVAKRLRDYIYQETQLSAFFDENDIAFGRDFAEVLQSALESGTAAMVAVNSDHYASRPWCRRELQVFARPRKLAVHGVWATPPVLVLQAMDGGHVSAAIPEFGNSPMLRWRKGDAALCIDTLLRESIFRAYHAALGGIIKKELEAQQSKAERGTSEHNHPVIRVFVNWIPDPLSLDTVIRAVKRKPKRADRDAESLEVVYPGRGLSFIETRALRERFPNVILCSFNEARPY